jgi:hypothetical protein
MLGSSWLIYTANDYLWDSYAPPPTKQTEDQAFDARPFCQTKAG